MKQFLKFTLASITGLIIGSVILFFLFAGLISIVIASAGDKEETKVKDKSVLHVTLENGIRERKPSNPFENFTSALEGDRAMGLDEIMESLDKAARDKRISGIFLDAGQIPAGMAMIEEIRNKLIEFRSSGKFIIAYGDYYSQSSYYLASVADKIYVNPEGGIAFNGLTANLLFVKETLEKLEIEPQIIRHGKFKAAVEPFMLDHMSEENRIQTKGYIGSMWSHMLNGIADSRELTAEYLQQLADSLSIREAEDAVTYKLADQLAYKDEVLEELKTRTEAESIDKINRVTLAAYTNAEVEDDKKSTLDRIAVIYAVGAIEGGEGDDETIGSDRISKAIREARLDEDVKAIVMRVNSPGGSALASEVIWREVVLARKEKPFIVSMGDLAASGGYYISCAADTIVAEPNTITGSIGVFGVLFNAQDFFRNKLGFTFDTVKTAAFSDLGSSTRPLTDGERAIIQESVEHVYDVFVDRVSDGRGMDPAMVDSIGQGRVWSGADALEIGLVDVLGGMDTALAIAARKANLDNYRVLALPERENPFSKLLGGLSDEARAQYISREMGEYYHYYRHLRSLAGMQGIQARIPYDIEIR